MTTQQTEVCYVILLSGPTLAPGGFAVPPPATAVWCRSVEELLDRTQRLRPLCVVADVTGSVDRAVLGQVIDAAREAVVALIGGSSDGSTVGIDAHGDVGGEVSRLTRFALGQPMRNGARVVCGGQAFIECIDNGETVRTPLVDLSEGGAQVVAPDRFVGTGEVTLKLALEDSRELSVRACVVRKASATATSSGSLGLRFLELTPRARAGLRSLLFHRAPAPATMPLAARAPATAAAARSTRIVGESAALRRATEVIERVAPTDVTVLILGETGTGKEVAARVLHERSPRADRPFVAINCAALPENLVESELFGHEAGAFTGAAKRKIGRIEQASGGTLFLDEIGDLPAQAQAKLLRALQERVIERVGGNEQVRVDIRLIAATNQDLESGVANRSFRRDLFFRLNVVTIKLPPLRSRGEDIPMLLQHFLERAQTRMGKRDIRLNEHALQAAQRYAWPGNVRELENVCTRLVALAPPSAILGPEHLNLISADELKDSPLPTTDLRDILEFCEREIVRRMLDRNGGNRTQTAKTLGISRQALQQKLARFRNAGEGESVAEPEEQPAGARAR